MQVAVDAAELVIGFEHPRGPPGQRHRAVPPALEVLGVLPANLDHGIGRAQRAGEAQVLQCLTVLSSSSGTVRIAGAVDVLDWPRPTRARTGDCAGAAPGRNLRLCTLPAAGRGEQHKKTSSGPSAETFWYQVK